MPRITGNPQFLFVGEDGRTSQSPIPGKRYFGLEWENNGSNGDDDASQFPDKLDILMRGKHNLFWHKRDGSLSNGYETVTQPMEYPALIEFLKEIKRGGLKSGNGNSNAAGIHVHVNKASFTLQARANLIMLIHANHDLSLKLSKRTQDRFNSWSSTRWESIDRNNRTYNFVLNDITSRTYSYFGGACNDGRHPYTTEIRMFNSENDPQEVIHIIDLVKTMCDFADKFSMPERLRGRQHQEGYIRKAFAAHVFKMPEQISEYYLKCIKETF